MNPDELADQLKNLKKEDIERILERLNINREDLDKLRDKLSEGRIGDLDLDKFGGDIGRLLRAIFGGATGADAEVAKKLIEVFGPTVNDALSDLIDSLLRRTKDGFDERSPGPGPHKRERINRNGPGFKEDRAPDIFLLSTPTVACAEGDLLVVSFEIRVENLEEPIASVQIDGFHAGGVRCGGRTISDGERGLPPRGRQRVRERYDLRLDVEIKCADALASGGRLLLQISVYDEDGNYTTDFVSANFLDRLLDRDGECCKTSTDEVIRQKLLEAILRRIGNITDADVKKVLGDKGQDGKAAGAGAVPVPGASKFEAVALEITPVASGASARLVLPGFVPRSDTVG